MLFKEHIVGFSLLFIWTITVLGGQLGNFGIRSFSLTQINPFLLIGINRIEMRINRIKIRIKMDLSTG
jgi:hypothetical protein